MTRTLALPELVDAPPADDPFRYGFRTALRVQSDGTLRSEMLPLTIWDTLHPQEGDHITQSIRHQKEVRYLTSVLETRVASDKTALVLSDTPIFWDTPGLSYHCPDVAVIFGIREQKEQWTSFYVTQESVRPDLIIEVVSPNVRSNDTTTKRIEYHAAGVPMYVIIDREKEDDWPTIRGYLWEPGQYKELALDDRDCLLLARLNLRLCSNQNRITLYDATTGDELGDHLAISQALEAEMKARQEAEKAALLAQEKAEAEEKARLAAEEQTRLARERADTEAKARFAAEEQARLAAEEQRKAEEQARLATDDAKLATQQLDAAVEAQRKAEDRARVEADACADLERRLRELEEKVRANPGE